MAGLFDEEPTVEVHRAQNTSMPVCREEKSTKTEFVYQHVGLDHLHFYQNPLIANATKLLAILISVPRQEKPVDLARFRQRLLDLIDNYRHEGHHLDYHPSVIDKACFVLCSAFDERIVHTRWGQSLGWENHSLVSKLFFHRNGGETFFALLDKARQQPAKLVNFLELQYVLLMLGFEGRYRTQNQTELHQIKSDLYSLIRQYREQVDPPKMITPSMINAPTPWQFLNVRKVIVSFCLILLCGFVASEVFYSKEIKQLTSLYDTFDISSILPEKNAGEIIYNSTDADLSDIPVVETAKIDENVSLPINAGNAPQWDIVLGNFTQTSEASEMIRKMQTYDYAVLTRNTARGIEVYMKVPGDLNRVRQLKRDIKVTTGIDAIIKKEQK